nr:hypothetical protein [Arcobacter nitrofigilis]
MIVPSLFTTTVPCSATAVVLTVPSTSLALKVIVVLPSSSTVFVVSTSNVGASFTSFTVIALVFVTVAPSSSFVVTVIVSFPL